MPGVEVERVSDAVWRVGTPTVGMTMVVGVASCGKNGSAARIAGFRTTDATVARHASTTTMAAITAMMPRAELFFFASGGWPTGLRLPVPGGAAPRPPALTGIGMGIGMFNASCENPGAGAMG